MGKLGKRLPSPAMVVACLALFIALGGVGAYAASKINGHEIKNGSIPLSKLTRAARIATVNLPANGPSQPGAEGKEGKEGPAGHNGSNGTEGKQGPEGKAGQPGEKGDKGEQGEPGTPGQPGTPGSPGSPGTPGSPGAPGPQGPPGLNSGEPRVVTSTDSWGWKLATYGDNSQTPEPGFPSGRGPEPANVVNGELEFATPPSAPSLGTQALKMTTNGHPVVAYPPLPIGNPPLLSELTSAGWDSLVVSSPAKALDVALQIEVIGSEVSQSGYTTLVDEPYQNGEYTVETGETGTEWHHHVLAAGGTREGLVWSTHAMPAGSPYPCSQNNPCELSQFIEENPGAVVLDAKLRIGQNNGEGWNGFEAYVDDVRLGFGEYNRYDLGG